jgi:sulfatase maturation enzyme AslB (radical SAM superfamily)
MNKNLNRFFKSPVIIAVELFSSGWCNLNCSYCYIPKTDFLKKVHSDIIKNIEDGTYLKNVKETVGVELDTVSLWGTESSLTTKHFKDFFKNAKEDFPKLKTIKLSSNFMTPPKNLIEFITEILPKDFKLNVEFQVSCDGPSYITDKNRIGGSTSKILENVLEVTKQLNESEFLHNLGMHFKPTLSADNMKVISEYDNCYGYYKFFDNFLIDWHNANSNKKINISNGVNPTLVLPGSYTVEDGKIFAKLYDSQMKVKELKEFKCVDPDADYYIRWKSKLFFYKEYFTKQKMFTCSAGDSCVAIGDIPGTIHPCHATFYLDHPEYYEEVKKCGLAYEAQKSLDHGLTHQLRDSHIVKNENENDLNIMRSLLITRSYNDFTKLRLSNSLALVLELAHAGQVSPIYKNVAFASILACLIQTSECPIDATHITGTMFALNSSLVRLFGNGYFERIFKRILKEMKNATSP